MSSEYASTNLYDEESSDSLSNGVLSFESLSFEGLPFFPTSSEAFEATEAISAQSKKIRKKRNAYQKIDDDLRLQLLEAVQHNGETLKSASKRLQINYSSAKSIIHTFRKEGRILKKSALERTINFCQYPLGEIDLNALTTYSQLAGRTFTGVNSDYQRQADYCQAPIYNYTETNFSSPMTGYSMNFTQQLLSSNNCSQQSEEKITIPRLLLNEVTDNKLEEVTIGQSGQAPQANGQSVEIPALNLEGIAPLESLKRVESFYMNYSNSPLSGGNGNFFRDNLNGVKDGSGSNNRTMQKEFESFSELISSFQSHQYEGDENNLLAPKLIKNQSSQFLQQERLDFPLIREDSSQSSGFSDMTVDLYKNFANTQVVFNDALKQSSFFDNLAQMRMTSARGCLDVN